MALVPPPRMPAPPPLAHSPSPALVMDPPGHRRRAPPSTARRRGAGVRGVYVFAGRRLSPRKMVAAAAAATEAQLKGSTTATAAPAGRKGWQHGPCAATGALRPGPRARLCLSRVLSRALPPPPLLLPLLFSLLLLPLPREAEAAAVAAAVSGSAAAEAKECDRPCVNGGRCNPGTGQCVCPTGWVGEQCQHCGGRFR